MMTTALDIEPGIPTREAVAGLRNNGQMVRRAGSPLDLGDEPQGSLTAVGNGPALSIVQLLASGMDSAGAFCVLWPSTFAYVAHRGISDAITHDDVFSVKREELESGFLERLAAGDGGTSVAADYSLVRHLPEALQRPPFRIDGTTSLSLPFRVQGYYLGFAGIALPRPPTEADVSWFAGCVATIALWIGDVRARRGADGERLHPFTSKPESEAPPARAAVASESGEPAGALSDRENQIAKFLAEGLSTVNVGAILGVSENTVRTYVRRIYKKLGVCSRVELVHSLRA